MKDRDRLLRNMADGFPLKERTRLIDLLVCDPQLIGKLFIWQATYGRRRMLRELQALLHTQGNSQKA